MRAMILNGQILQRKFINNENGADEESIASATSIN
jgi:hypothetical protein